MQRISVSQALGSGFRLIAREPSSLAAWLAAYVVYTIAMWGLMLVAVPGLLGDYIALMRAATSGGSAEAQAQALAQNMSGMLVVMPLVLLSALVFAAVFVGAIYRAVLQPEARRMAYLRFGRQELWLLLSLLVWGLLCMLVYLLIMIPLNIVGAILIGVSAAATGGGTGSLVAMIGMFLLMAVGWLLTLWVMVRLSVGLPMSFDQARFVAFEGWRATRGQTGQTLKIALGLFAIVVGLYAVLAVVALAVLAAVFGGWQQFLAADPGGLSHMGPLFIGFAVVLALFGVAMYVILAAPSADIYRQVKGQEVGVF